MSWLSDLFNRRFKGFRVVELATLACLTGMILGVYAFKAGAGRESAQIADVEARIAEEARHARLYRAELAHLEEPARLTRISVEDLGLAPADAKREAPVDSLPELSKHLAPPAPRPGSGAPAAPPAGADR